MSIRFALIAALLLVPFRAQIMTGNPDSPVGSPRKPCSLDGIHQPVRISGGLAIQHLLTHTNPDYPPEAKKKYIEGIVVLHAIISNNGLVEKLTPMSGPDLLVKPAIDAVSHWTYRPYILECHPVEVDTMITVNFKLNDAH
jgi:hypothetical protein